MPRNKHFVQAPTWRAAAEMLTFPPRQPTRTAGCGLQSLEVHVRDHRGRDLPPGGRSLEAHYGRFVVSQARKGAAEARRLALSTPYGADARTAQICGHDGRAYELGPEPPPDDIDGRSPAVLTWHDGEMFYLVASGELQVADLVGIAQSLYDTTPERQARGRR